MKIKKALALAQYAAKKVSKSSGPKKFVYKMVVYKCLWDVNTHIALSGFPTIDRSFLRELFGEDADEYLLELLGL